MVRLYRDLKGDYRAIAAKLYLDGHSPRRVQISQAKQGSSHSCNRVCRFWHFEILREVYESRLRVILCIFRHPNAR